MATKTDIELKIVDSVDTSHSDAEVLADSASNPDAFYVGRGYLAKGGEKVIENIDEKGTYPNVTVGNATKATSADTATRANTAATAATAVNISDAPVLTATEDEQITVKVGNKTSNALTVPYAQRADFATDLSGRVEATPEVFTYRPSAGDKSIKDYNAYIRRVKGNSVVWNPMISSILRRENFEGVTTYYDPTTNECVIENISRSSNYSSGSNRLAIQPATNFVSGHKYILVCNKNITGVGVYDQNAPLSFQTVNTIFSATDNSAIYFRIDKTFDFASQCPVGETLRLKIQLYDLTTMLGAGNEPATVEEFRYLFPRKAYDYSEGILLNLSCYGIRTIGFNLINKNNFADGVISNSETPVLNANYRHIKIAVFPNTEYYLKDVSNYYYYNSYILYDNDMNRIKASGKVVTEGTPYNVSFVITTPINAAYMIVNVHKDFVDSCCVNLHHTGYRDGEYEPYKEVTHTLPLSQITNGQPLRKAGSVYDEINETEYIKRVGVRSYTEGDKDDAALLTDGTYTNYPLDEPIYTPITIPIDFNYYVEDFGTEEALLQEDSAPFSADIVYQFNATDQVRNNSRAIKWLKKSAFMPTGTTAQYVRGDGSYGNMSELSRVIPINDGEHEKPDAEDYYDRQFILTPNYYAKSPVELDNTATVAVYVTPSDTSSVLAEYWFEFAIGDTMPNITFLSSYENTVFRFGGEMMTDATNILHITSSDGGVTFFGEIKNYII